MLDRFGSRLSVTLAIEGDLCGHAAELTGDVPAAPQASGTDISPFRALFRSGGDDIGT